MTLLGFAVFVSAMTIFIVSVTLLLYPGYEHGFVGKLALLTLCGGAIIPIWDTFHTGANYSILPTTTALYLGTALFMARHFYRYYKFTHEGAFSWQRNKENPRDGDQGIVDYMAWGRRLIYLFAVTVTALLLWGT